MGLFTAHYTSYPDRCVHSNTEVFLYSAVSSPWDCSQRITLHTLTDVLIQYRSVLVYCSIQSVGLFTAHCTSYPDICVHSNTEATSLGSIQPRSNYCAKTFRRPNLNMAVKTNVSHILRNTTLHILVFTM